MNKGITLLILLVVLCAMGIVFFSHVQQSTDGSVVRETGSIFGNSSNTPAATDGIVPIVPPASTDSTSEGALGTPTAPATSPESSTTGEGATTSGSLPVTPPAQPDRQSGVPKPVKPVPPATPAVKPEAPAAAAPATPAAKPVVEEGASAPKSDVRKGSSGKHVFKSASIHFSGAKIRFRLEADTEFSYKTMQLSGPNRFVIDLPGTWKGVKAPEVPKNRIISKVRTGQQQGAPRIVLDLHGALKTYEVERISPTIIEFILE